MTRFTENSFRFVMSHYREGAFKPRMIFYRSPLRTRRATAAAVAACVILVASACYFVFSNRSQEPAMTQPSVSAPTPQAESPVFAESLRLEFDNAPLPVVVAEIEAAYGVKIYGLPDDSDSIRLTLSFEGTADELIDAINQITGLTLGINVDAQ